MCTSHRKRGPHTLTRPPCYSQLRARARAGTHSRGSRMHETLVAPHEFPCSLWVVPTLGFLNTHRVHLPPQARPPHTPPPALLQPAARARARARAQSLRGVTDAWDFGRGSSFPLLTLGCPTTRALGHTLCAPPTASAAPTHSPARPAAASCARARAGTHSRAARMHETLVAPHEFPCSLWVALTLGLLNTHYNLGPPLRNPPH